MTGCDDIDWVGLGKALREARDLCHRSQESAAVKLCLSGKQIRALESGSGVPFPGDTVRSWCARRYATQLGLDWESFAQPPRSDAIEAPALLSIAPETAPAVPAPGAGKQLRLRLLLGATAMLVVIVIAAYPRTRNSAPLVSPPVADVGFKAAPPAPAAVRAGDSSAAVETAPVDNGQVDAKDETILAAAVESAAIAPIAVTPQTGREPASRLAGNVVEVLGIDSSKSPEYFFINSKDASVLVKRKRQDPSGGVRMDFAQGSAKRVPIAADELVRVEEGKDVEIFYQGRMLPPQVIASGNWARFVQKSAEDGN